VLISEFDLWSPFGLCTICDSFACGRVKAKRENENEWMGVTAVARREKNGQVKLDELLQSLDFHRWNGVQATMPVIYARGRGSGCLL